METVVINEVPFALNRYGMLRQLHPRPFNYDSAYLAKQSTNVEMSYLRLGFLMASVPYDDLKACRAVELGPGTGVFYSILKPHVAGLSGYDVAEGSAFSTVSIDELRSRQWDLLCGFDVVEHLPDIDDLWKIDFKWGYFSLPAPPSSGVTAEWRHFKPDEHIWYISADQFCSWARDHGYSVIARGCPEDCIRRRWNTAAVNINSFIIRRN